MLHLAPPPVGPGFPFGSPFFRQRPLLHMSVGSRAPRHDFTPLLQFVSASPPKADSASASAEEVELAESYRNVGGHEWHSFLEGLCSSSSSWAYDVAAWLSKHSLCYSYELLYSILIHGAGGPEQVRQGLALSDAHPLAPPAYNALIGVCARTDDPRSAVVLLSRMHEQGLQSDFPTYSLLLESLSRSPNPDPSILHSLYHFLLSDHLHLDFLLLNHLILAFSKARDPSSALRLLASAEGCGFILKTSTLVSLVLALAHSGRIDEAEALFAELQLGPSKPLTHAYNALLRGYVKAGSLTLAESLVSDMDRNRVPPDELTYSLLIDAYANVGRWESVRIVLKEMEASTGKPSALVYSRILASYRDQGQWEKSFQVLKDMKSNGVQPDIHFYNVMIDTFGKYNCLDHAMSTFEKMLSEGIQPDTVTWNTLIDCHCKAGRHERAEELFREMQESGFAPCATTYNIMINSFGEQEKWDNVKQLLGEMQNKGFIPNIVTYTTLVDNYGRSGRFEDAMECLEAMKSGGLKPSSTMYNALINAYAQRGLSENAVNVFQIMCADGLKPTSILALNSLINAFGEDRRDAEAFAVLQYMKENDLNPDVVTYTTLMKTLIRVQKYNKVPSVYEEMILSGCSPDRKARAMLRTALNYMKQSLE